MLSWLKMSVADCIAAYLSLSNRVFRKTGCCWFGYRYHTSSSHTHTYI
jgi:hypothetical protein